MGSVLKPTSQEDNNLPIYPLIWLDSLVNTSVENLDGQKLIRSSIDLLKTFENVNKCEEYIRSISQNERLILIVSGRLGQEIVPRIHQLRQVSSIFVYCLDKSANEQWAKQYKKIKDIITKFDELIDKIRLERSKRGQNEVNETLSSSIFQSNTYEHFLYSQLLIDILLRLKPVNTDKKKFIYLCKEKYQEIYYELTYVEEFDETYASNEAVQWYMKDTFLYRTLNRALRLQNLDILFLLRFFLQDIRQEIKQNKCTNPIRVYRSQLMTKEEIVLLQNSIGNLLSINSFLSTSIHRELALVFLNQASFTNDLERVLLEIYADPSTNSLKPFTFIKSNNSFRQTEEVLFTLGSIFRLISIQRQSDGLWIVQLRLCEDNEEELNEMFKPYIKNQQINILSFGNLLIKLGKLNEAKKFFSNLRFESLDNSQDIADCYYALGCIAMEKGDYNLALDWQKKSLETKLQVLKEDDISLVDNYNSIGQIYRKKTDYQQALSSYLRVLKITMEKKGENHLDLARCYTFIGGIYQKQEQYTHALECYEKALAIREKNYTTDHPDLGISHNNIAIIHSCRNEYTLALEHYNKSLKILQNTLPSSHPEIAVCYCGLGLIAEQQNELQKALSYYEKTAVIYRQALSSTHPDVIQIEQHIKRIMSKLL